jgi:hypothetical protein
MSGLPKSSGDRPNTIPVQFGRCRGSKFAPMHYAAQDCRCRMRPVDLLSNASAASNLKDRLDLDRHAERQRIRADSAAGADARLEAEDFGK